MKTKLILLSGIVVALGSCTSAYRTGQTPDDVYYSPVPPQQEYVTTENQQDKDSYAYNNNTDNMEDLAIRRGINDPLYRSNLSLSFGYGYNPYDYYGSSFYNPYSSFYPPYSYPFVTFSPYSFYNNYYGNFYSPYNNFYSPYNNYYSPYYNYSYPYYFSKTEIPSANYTIQPRRYNLRAYNVNTAQSNNSSQNTNVNSYPARTFRQQRNTTGVGNLIRRIFTPSNNNNTDTYRNNTNNNNNNSAPARTFQTNTSSGSSNSSSSGSSGGGAPARSFRH